MLVLCLTIKFNPNHPTGTQPLDLTNQIKAAPKFLYRNSNGFSAIVIGELRINFKHTNLTKNFSKYDRLLINDLVYDPNMRITLYWQVNEHQYHKELNLNTNAVTPINFRTNDSNHIKDLHLIIYQDPTLGLNHSPENEIKFKSITLAKQSSNIAINETINSALSFNPIQFSSINSNTQNESLIYQSLIFRLAIWILLVAVTFWLLKVSSNHLLSSLFLAWLIATVFFLNERTQQKWQVEHAYPNKYNQLNHLNQDDLEAYELAQKIRSALIEVNQTSSAKEKTVLVNPLDFFTQRLMNHLNDLSVSTRHSLSYLLDTINHKNMTYVLIKSSTEYCTNAENPVAALIDVTYKGDLFCIVRKK